MICWSMRSENSRIVLYLSKEVTDWSIISLGDKCGMAFEGKWLWDLFIIIFNFIFLAHQIPSPCFMLLHIQLAIQLMPLVHHFSHLLSVSQNVIWLFSRSLKSSLSFMWSMKFIHFWLVHLWNVKFAARHQCRRQKF